VDEYTLTAQAGNAEQVLQSHWASWATEGDFQKIKASGLNLVRIPVGYWAFEKYPGDPYIQGAAEYLDQAVQWAANAGLNVWIDLHGELERHDAVALTDETRCAAFTERFRQFGPADHLAWLDWRRHHLLHRRHHLPGH
jgi:hypothetical protein